MVTLIILDGFGISKEKFGNAITSAGTPNLDKLIRMYPNTTLKASGNAVGLPEGQMGVYSKALWNPYVLASLLSPPRLP